MNDRVTKEEIEKWVSRIPDVSKLKAKSAKGEEWLTNLKAYLSDCRYFEERGDLVRSFEAMVWACAIYEILKDMSEI